MRTNDPAVLRRLGPVPFWRGEEKCLDSLRTMYSRAMERARAASAADGARGGARKRRKDSAAPLEK